MSILGGMLGGAVSSGLNFLTSRYFNKKDQASAEAAARRNEDFQREFAKQGLRWRVEDAKSAGINPLAALGANIPTGNPVAVGSNSSVPDMSQLGQDISRAMGAKMTKEEREIHELKKELMRVQIDGQRIDNTNAKNTGTGGYFPDQDFSGLPDQVRKTGTQLKPSEITSAKETGVESGVHAFYGDRIAPDGTLWRMPSEKTAEILESSFPDWLQYNVERAKEIGKSWYAIYNKGYRNDLARYLKPYRPDPPDKNHEYRWDVHKARWRLSKKTYGKSRMFFEPSRFDKNN